MQDLIRGRAEDVVRLLKDENTYLYLCGLKGMEKGVDEAFADICSRNGLDWKAVQAGLLQQGRYHVETY